MRQENNKEGHPIHFGVPPLRLAFSGYRHPAWPLLYIMHYKLYIVFNLTQMTQKPQIFSTKM